MSAEEVWAIVTQVIGKGVPLQGYVYLLLIAISFLASGVGAFFGSYLRKRGEHRAIQQDLGKIIKQLQQTTMATEEIKAQISGDLWVKQRWRELQLDVLKEINAAFVKIKLGLDIPNYIVSPEIVERLYCATILAGALFKDPTIKVFIEAAMHFHLDPSRKPPTDFYKLHLEAIKAMIEEACK